MITPLGQTIHGTRVGLGPDFQNDSFIASIGNSNYNAFEASLRHSGRRLNAMVYYMFSKSIDQLSSLADPISPFNYGLTRALSAWDLTHNLVTTWLYQLPLDRLFMHARRWSDGWSLSGIVRASAGFPSRCIPTVTILCWAASPTE